MDHKDMDSKQDLKEQTINVEFSLIRMINENVDNKISENHQTNEVIALMDKNAMTIEHEHHLKDKTNDTFGDVECTHNAESDETEHRMCVALSKLNDQTSMKDETFEKYNTLIEEYTCIKEDLEKTTNKLTCTEQKLQDATLELNRVMFSTNEIVRNNKRLDNECMCLRRNFRNAVNRLTFTELKLKEALSKLNHVNRTNAELEEKMSRFIFETK